MLLSEDQENRQINSAISPRPRDWAIRGLVFMVWLFLVIVAFSARDPFFLAPFRESQNAISADYYIREPSGSVLAYQIPVLGIPWSIPIEFPLCQIFTAYTVRTTGLSVAQAGRVVSLVGYLLCIAALAWLGWESTLHAGWRRWCLTLFAASPVYVAFSIAHLMESWALLLALLYVGCTVRYTKDLGLGWMAGAIITGALAAIVKITTWLPAGSLIFFIALAKFWGRREKGELRDWCVRWVGPALTAVIALGSGVLWSKWAAEIRSANVMNEAIQSEATLRQWVFGTFGDRLSVTNWLLLGGKQMLLIFGPLGLAVPLLIVLGVWKGGQVEHPARHYLWIASAAYLVHAVVFMTLNLRHDYYAFEAGIYAIVALVIALAIIKDTVPGYWANRLVLWMVSSMMLGSIVYIGAKRNYHDFATEAAIDTVSGVREEGALIIFGFDWSPRIAFATGRKALMVDGSPNSIAALPASLVMNRGTRFVGAIVLGRIFDAAARQAALGVGLDPNRKVWFCPDGYLLLKPGVEAQHVQDSNFEQVLSELRSLIPQGRTLPDGLLHMRLTTGPHGEGWGRFVVKRRSNAFFVRLDRLSVVRVRGYFTE